MLGNAEADTGEARLVEITQAVLLRLGVEYRRGALTKLAQYERLLATTPSHWPSHAGSVVPYARDPAKQLSALEGVLRAVGLEVDFIEAPPSELGSHGEAELLVLRSEGEGCCVALLLGRTAAGVECRMPDGRNRTVGVGELEALYAGVLLAVRRSGQTQRSTTKHVRDERWLALATTWGSGAVLAFWTIASGLRMAEARSDRGTLFLWFVLLGLDAVGLALVGALGRIEAKSTASGLLKRACSFHQSWSCDRVLGSRAANLVGPVSMIDAGAWYFAAHYASLLVGATQGDIVGVLDLAFLSAAASLPYVVFSLLYQAWKVRAWCPFCITVQLVLVSELACLVPVSRNGIVFPRAATTVLVGVTWSVVAVLLLVTKARDLGVLRLEARQLRLDQILRNRAVFTTLLLHGARVDAEPLPTDAILSEATEGIPILAVLDPQCAHCARCYDELLGWAREFRSRVLIAVRVSARFSHLPLAEDVGRLALLRNEDAVELLRSWYGHVLRLEAAGRLADHGGVAAEEYQSWRASHSSVPGGSAADDVTAACKGWESAQQVTTWPALFVAGYPWPSFYAFGRFLPRYLVDIEQALQGGAAVCGADRG